MPVRVPAPGRGGAKRPGPQGPEPRADRRGIAAATTSLPEEVGGERNREYRFSRLRDSAALLAALTGLGYTEEAGDFAGWLVQTAAGRADELQIMYGIAAERTLHEASLDHLGGYRGSRPVRIGNGARDQFQLDVYGELVAAAWFLRAHRAEPADGSLPGNFPQAFSHIGVIHAALLLGRAREGEPLATGSWTARTTRARGPTRSPEGRVGCRPCSDCRTVFAPACSTSTAS